MVGAVPASGIAVAAPTILWIIWREAAQAIRGEQLTSDHIDNALGLVGRQHRMRQADGENLIRPNGAVGLIAVHNIV